MHELGIVFELIKQVDEVADANEVDKVEAIIVQVGELSSVVPHYLEECFPAAIDGMPRYSDTELKIEILPGVAECSGCHHYFNVAENEGYCPKCNSFDKELVQGREFNIKEIVV